MAFKRGKGLAGANGEALRKSSALRGREPYKPNRPAALAALRRSLAGATEPALRERLALAVASLEERGRP